MSPLAGKIYAFGPHTPVIDPTSYVSPGAMIIGQVHLHQDVSIWFNTVLRGDLGLIDVGAGSNIQDNTTIHVEGAEERPDGRERGTQIGRNVTVGHNCVIHSCTLEDECLIGMGAIVMSGAVVGRGAIVGAGAVVLEDTRIPPYSLAVGNPAQVRKSYAPEFVQSLNVRAAAIYRQRIDRFKHGLVEVP